MGKLNNTIIATIIILAVTGLVIFFMAIPRIDRYLSIKAVEICSNSSRYVSKDESFTAEYPLKEVYENCISTTK